MISFENLHLDDASPIYLQIIRYIKRGIVAGTIREGEEMPSRRMLSALLGVNPNTVQKAYKQLEDEGVIRSHAGAKSCVSAGDDRIAALRQELIRGEMELAIHALQQMGVTLEEAAGLLNDMWKEE